MRAEVGGVVVALEAVGEVAYQMPARMTVPQGLAVVVE